MSLLIQVSCLVTSFSPLRLFFVCKDTNFELPFFALKVILYPMIYSVIKANVGIFCFFFFFKCHFLIHFWASTEKRNGATEE